MQKFNPQDYAILQWYFPASFALLVVTLTVVLSKTGRKSEASNTLFRIWRHIVTLVNIVLCFLIIQSVINTTSNNKCNFNKMPKTSFLVFISYLFSMLQILVHTIVNPSETTLKDDIVNKVKSIMPPWNLLYKRVGYNWLVILRNMVFQVLEHFASMTKSVGLQRLVSNVSVLTLLVFVLLRVYHLYRFLSGDVLCTGVLPSFIADLIASSLPLLKMMRSEKTTIEKKEE